MIVSEPWSYKDTLSMGGSESSQNASKYIYLCSEDERMSYRFGTTWGWVINDRICIFGWTIPLNTLCWIFQFGSVESHSYHGCRYLCKWQSPVRKQKVVNDSFHGQTFAPALGMGTNTGTRRAFSIKTNWHTALVAVHSISTRTSSSVPAPFMAFLSSLTANTWGGSSMARMAFSKLPVSSLFKTSTSSFRENTNLWRHALYS